MTTWFPAAVLVLVALLHSVLGERLILKPLEAGAIPPTPIGRAMTLKTLRFAWHLTSLAWLALAALGLRGGEENAPILGGFLWLSALIAFLGSRGKHFAWWLFLIGGTAASLGARVESVAPWAGWLAALSFAGISALHFAWAAGLRWGIDKALPQLEGKRLFTPPGWLTVLVALIFAGTSVLAVYTVHTGARWASWLCLGAALVLTLRTTGDFRTVGLFKRVHQTSFARWDDQLYTPLCAVLSLCFALVGVGGLR